jgi:predicted amidophosphoribosyltransferase
LPLLQRYFEINVNPANALGCLFILGTGNTVIEAVKVLIEHGVQPSVIILLSLFSTPHGEFKMRQ